MASKTTATKATVKRTRKPKVAEASLSNTSHKRDLDAMSSAHRSKLERWDALLPVIGAQHVWASSPRFKGRGNGPFYLAVKAGAKDYRIVSFDTSKPTVKAKVLVKGVTSPKTILAEFKTYRLKAKDERTSKPTAKASAKPKPKVTTKRSPAKAKAS